MLRYLIKPHSMTYVSSHQEVFFKKEFLKVSGKTAVPKSLFQAVLIILNSFNEFCEIGATSKIKKSKCTQIFPKKVYMCFVYI